MGSHAVYGNYVPVGMNHSNQYFIDALLTEALANGNTLDITLPDSVPKDALPWSAITYTYSGGVYTVDVDLASVTTHTVATGVTRLTAAGNVASGARVRLIYLGA